MKNIMNIKRIISIILVTVVLVLSSNIYAANDSFKTSLTVSKSQLEREDTFTVTMQISDINIESGEKGIGAYTAKLEFDSSVLEFVSSNGIGKWEAPFYQDAYITGNTNDGNVVNTNQSIGTFEFKVKANAKLGDTTIKLVNFSGSTAATDVSAADSSIKITIVAENPGDGSGDREGGSGDRNTAGGGNTASGGNTAGGGSTAQGGQNGNGGNTNQNGNSANTNQSNNTANTPSVNGSSNSKSENLKSNTLPKTGTSNPAIIYIIIIICVLAAIGCVVRIRVLNNKSRHSDK